MADYKITRTKSLNDYYVIGKITINNEEYRVVTDAIEQAGREGGT